jgi:hypothetical protein
MADRTLDVATSFGASVARFGSGMRWRRSAGRQRLLLYEFKPAALPQGGEGAVTLDLDATIYPCPKKGPRFRPEVVRRGGKALFPFLVDPNTGRELYESDDIVTYLFDQYGDGHVPLALRLGPLTDVSSMLASAWRPTSGARYEPAKHPAKPLTLYGFEGPPSAGSCASACAPFRSVRAAQRRQRQRPPRGLRQAVGQDDGAVSGRSEYRHGNVRVGRHRCVLGSHVREEENRVTQ